MLHQLPADDHLRNDEDGPTQPDASEDLTVQARITTRIAALGDWRGEMLASKRSCQH